MPRFRTAYNHEPSQGEVIEGKSLTVPDRSLTLREIFDRFARGQPLDNIQRNVEYQDVDDDMSDWSVDPTTVPGVDIVDLENFSRENKKLIKELEDKIKNDTGESVTEAK
ncbi:hypothetical protein [Sigmofec virus UA08Rod_6926]|uniref:Uncharacterized protein n=1 Tax=Sigmofec virus UA08Rod_6926 TaxID=2929241 RepID=A0A976N0W1_9VIRU|nr:hypothetical protein [Sigmofec virus UA08Rod_6926]